VNTLFFSPLLLKTDVTEPIMMYVKIKVTLKQCIQQYCVLVNKKRQNL